MSVQSRPGLGIVLYFGAALLLAAYFAFAAVQGQFGLFARAEIQADSAKLDRKLTSLQDEIVVMKNRTRRLSDDYLDLDLLDQQSRDVLGQIRGDEFILR